MCHTKERIVHDVKSLPAKAGDELAPGVQQASPHLHYYQKRKINEGDRWPIVTVTRVVSAIMRKKDMPFLQMVPVDIMLNQWGFHPYEHQASPKLHPGMAAHEMGIKIATPVFDSCLKMSEARKLA